MNAPARQKKNKVPKRTSAVIWQRVAAKMNQDMGLKRELEQEREKSWGR